jgi:hypothetical protein
MLRYYDLLFYLIFSFYRHKEKGAAASSAAILGGLLAMNVLTIAMLITYLLSPETHFSIIIVIAVGVLFQVISYVRYLFTNNNLTARVDERWLKISKTNQTRIKTISFAYVLLSLASFVGLNIYWGNSR